MSWFTTALQVGTTVMIADQVGTLRRLERNQANAGAVMAILSALRDQLFQFNQLARTILDRWEENPKAALAALKVLHAEMDESGLSPGLFTEFADKEYCLTTFGQVSDGIRRIAAQVSPGTVAEVDDYVRARLAQPDYEYYLDHLDEYEAYREALPKYERLEQRNRSLWTVARYGAYYFLLWPMITTVLITILGVLTAFGGGQATEAFAAGSCLAFVGGCALTVFVAWHIEKSWVQRPAFSHAKTIVKSARENIDVGRMTQLAQRFGFDRDTVEADYRQLQQRAGDALLTTR